MSLGRLPSSSASRVGAVVFFFIAPGKPAVGVINIPFTVIEENSAFVIGRHIDYALQDDSIKSSGDLPVEPGRRRVFE